MQQRKRIFRTPEKFRAYPECKNCIFATAKKNFLHPGEVPGVSGVQKLYFCNSEKGFFALRRSSGRIRSAKIVFLQQRKRIFCTPEKFRAYPECKNCIFATAKKNFSHSGEVPGVSGVQKLYFCNSEKGFFALRRSSGRIRSAKIVFLQQRKRIFRTPEKFRAYPECKNCIFATAKKNFSHSGEVPGESGVQKLYFCNSEKEFFALRRSSGRIRSAKIVFLQQRKRIFRTPEKFRAYPECKNCIFATAKKNFSHSGEVPGVSGVQKLYFCNSEKEFFALRRSSGRIRSAKIVFLQQRKRIFRTPEKFRAYPECKNCIFATAKKNFSHSGEVPGVSGVQKLYFCNSEKEFFALRRSSGRIRSAKIVFLQQRKRIFRTPEKFRAYPECKNCIFATAKKNFSHSGEVPGVSGVQKLYFCNSEKEFFALRRSSGRIRSAKIVFLQQRKRIFRTPEKFRAYPECKNCIFATAKKNFSHSGEVPGVSGVQKLYFCNLLWSGYSQALSQNLCIKKM
ncbi:Uncharacterized protein dnm_100210 [Desulfonema magnum]|uniref:Uncharacterized protein n=1 Tax=Desulfonema magnum TaxID=45655 RepID=A0A975GWH0_9BACT|nr:Uncharacterized protein dnm_100210 [Desulfonema magnum]